MPRSSTNEFTLCGNPLVEALIMSNQASVLREGCWASTACLSIAFPTCVSFGSQQKMSSTQRFQQAFPDQLAHVEVSHVAMLSAVMATGRTVGGQCWTEPTDRAYTGMLFLVGRRGQPHPRHGEGVPMERSNEVTRQERPRSLAGEVCLSQTELNPKMQ